MIHKIIYFRGTGEYNLEIARSEDESTYSIIPISKGKADELISFFNIQKIEVK